MNPWLVKSLDDFLFFHCPECDNKHSEKPDFLNHALTTHSRSRNTILNLKDVEKILKPEVIVIEPASPDIVLPE